jgi:pimeloyl-ACP methyl ester carboxylesterase
MRLPHWSEALSVLRVEGSWRGTLAEAAMRTLIYLHEADKGGYFAAWEQPELFAQELRAAFKSLR